MRSEIVNIRRFTRRKTLPPITTYWVSISSKKPSLLPWSQENIELLLEIRSPGHDEDNQDKDDLNDSEKALQGVESEPDTRVIQLYFSGWINTIHI